jgi:hypothetical protein
VSTWGYLNSLGDASLLASLMSSPGLLGDFVAVGAAQAEFFGAASPYQQSGSSGDVVAITETATIVGGLGVGAAAVSQRIFNTLPTSGTQSTAPIATEARGSTFLMAAARGIWANGTPALPFDSNGNTFTAIGGSPNIYNGFPASENGIWIALGNTSIGGANHTASIGWGLSSAGNGDEVTIALIEVPSSNILQDQSWVDDTATSANLTSGNVTTTGPAVLVAFVWGYGGTGVSHVYANTSGFTLLSAATADGDPDPAGYIQLSTFYKVVTAAGTYSITVQGTGGEAAQIYLVALQQGAVPTNYTRSPADSDAIPIDALARFATFVRGAAGNAAAPTDGAARVVAQIRGLTDSAAAPNDATAGSKVIIRALADSDTAPTDATARVLAGARAPADSNAAPIDGVARTVAQARTLVDSDAAPIDAATRAFVTARTPADTATAPTAAVSRSLGATRVAADNDTAPTDAVARTTAQARALVDSDVAPTDATSGLKLILRAGSDSAPAPADSVARQVAQARAIADSDIAPVGGLARAAVTARGIADSDAAPTATGSGIRLTIRATADAAPAPADGVARSTQQSRTIADALAIPADAIARLAAAIRGASSSSAAPTSGLIRVAAATRSVSDTLVLPPDAVARLASAIRAAAGATAIPADATDGRVPHGAFSQAASASVAAPADQLGQLRVNGRAASADVPAPTDVLRYKHGSSTGSRTSTPAAAQSHTKPFAAESYTKPTRAKIEEQ